jgi:hypothetical protein
MDPTNLAKQLASRARADGWVLNGKQAVLFSLHGGQRVE